MSALAALEKNNAPGVERALIYLGLDDRENVLTTLEAADRTGVSFQPYSWPEYEALHSNPRFHAVMKKFGIPHPPRHRVGSGGKR